MSEQNVTTLPEKKLKSCLDGVPVKDFTSMPAFSVLGCSAKQQMPVVGHCPACGNPIYGPKEAALAEEVAVVRTCGCVQPRSGGLPMQTK